jgi:hypothetical protein
LFVQFCISEISGKVYISPSARIGPSYEADGRSISYDNTQQRYDVSRILTPEVTLDETAYRNYSPLYLSTTFGFSYALCFGSLTAVLMHTVCFHHREIIDRFKTSSERDEDIHLRLYRKYPEVPDRWYFILFGLMMVISIIVCEAWDTRLPWWGFLVTQLIPFIFTLPIGIAQAITNVQIGISLPNMTSPRFECHHGVRRRLHVPGTPPCQYDD